MSSPAHLHSRPPERATAVEAGEHLRHRGEGHDPRSSGERADIHAAPVQDHRPKCVGVEIVHDLPEHRGCARGGGGPEGDEHRRRAALKVRGQPRIEPIGRWTLPDREPTPPGWGPVGGGGVFCKDGEGEEKGRNKL